MKKNISPDSTLINKLNSIIVDKLQKKLSNISKTLKKEFNQETDLEILIGAITFSAKLASNLNLSKESFLSLCHQYYTNFQIKNNKSS